MRSRFPLRGMAVAWRTGGAVEAAETAVRTSRRPRSTDHLVQVCAGVCVRLWMLAVDVTVTAWRASLCSTSLLGLGGSCLLNFSDGNNWLNWWLAGSSTFFFLGKVVLIIDKLYPSTRVFLLLPWRREPESNRQYSRRWVAAIQPLLVARVKTISTVKTD
jgi:hypothetical protein